RGPRGRSRLVGEAHLHAPRDVLEQVLLGRSEDRLRVFAGTMRTPMWQQAESFVMFAQSFFEDARIALVPLASSSAHWYGVPTAGKPHEHWRIAVSRNSASGRSIPQSGSTCATSRRGGARSERRRWLRRNGHADYAHFPETNRASWRIWQSSH